MIRDLKRLDIGGGPASDGVVTSKLGDDFGEYRLVSIN